MDVLEFGDVGTWDGWLAQHHDSAPQAWLRIRRKNADLALITIGEALDGALCHGWIDSVRRSLDDVSFLQRYSPRRPRSPWSQLNVARAEALEAAGRMRAAGRAEVAAARADGRWDAAYVRQADSEVPPDLTAALAANPRAAEAFGQLGRTAQYAIVLPLLKAGTPQARERLVARAVDALTGDA
ncbi:YdeI/OmpD-associated family protein [Aeromicrobium senzhongii]|uniref:YdeI/OmpD-associated family protein n=1 Tax=Aeromicrobium senzhongii TaxID=2663859 RepID=A0ABX6SR33_9ACTN|nr:YdeI/OmpD-associated family protein [Aeromicrobium senzhongii]MTB88873.1 OmdA domain containing protein [Aeromicrobium senzhongii]QNL93841.1 YdeI/OmpD-associated family protein [Aeromicrobium senzhongii]